MSYLFQLNITDIFPLASQPHLDALAVDFGLDLIPSIFFTQNFSRRQAVQDGIDIAANVGKVHAIQVPAVHELDALSEFAFLKTLIIRNAETF